MDWTRNGLVNVTYTTDTTNERLSQGCWSRNLNTSWTPASIITILRRFKLACIFTTSVACCLRFRPFTVLMGGRCSVSSTDNAIQVLIFPYFVLAYDCSKRLEVVIGENGD